MSETKLDRDVEAIKARALPARLDPQALIEKAITSGASIDTLERLVTLAKDVRQVTAREAFFEAKAEFQRRCPTIKKTKTAKIATRSGGSFAYSYAPLDEIIATVDPVLSELGFSKSWTQRPEVNGVSANCVLAHKLGHQEESGYITMPYGTEDGRMNGAQRVGSALTYARRYSLLAILGLAPEDDDDAHGSAGPDGQARAAHPPGDPAVPRTDPEEHRAESETLLPTPDEDQERQALVNGIARIIKDRKITPTQRAKLKEVWLGDQNADPMTADLAALAALKAHLEQA